MGYPNIAIGGNAKKENGSHVGLVLLILEHVWAPFAYIAVCTIRWDSPRITSNISYAPFVSASIESAP